MERGMMFETYPPMFSDYEGRIENENYDDEVLVFVVPEEWCKNWIQKNCNCSVCEFFETWDWDDGNNMWTDAHRDGVLIAEWIELRDYRDYTNQA
jgi:hypothetical protein